MAGKLTFDFRSTDTGFDALKKELTALGAAKSFAKAGVLGKSAEREPGAGQSAPFSNVDVAMANEFGTEAVPERSFIRAAFDNNQLKYIDQLRRLARAIYDRKVTVAQALGLLGAQCASDIRNLVRVGSGVPPPNSSATIARKGSSHTLVDTGQLINAVTHEVVKGSSGSDSQ